MKRLLCIITLSLLFTACKKDNSDLLQTDISVHEKISTNNIEPVPAPPSYWVQMTVPSGIDESLTTAVNQVIQVNGAIYSLIGQWVYKSLYKFNTLTRTWIHSNDFSTYGESHIMFAYQSKIYIGFSGSSNALQNDFKSYDVATGVTTILPSFPGPPVQGATYFIIGNKGYLLGGETYTHNNINHLWEFNFSTNQWTNKGNSPIGARVYGDAFVFDNKVYLGLGHDYLTLNGVKITMYKNDWVLYDPANNSSAARANFPGQKREAATGFILNGMPYVGLGRTETDKFTDFYQYNPFTNVWTQKASWPGTISTHHQFAGFSVGTTGYVVKSALDEFWRFNVNN